MVFYSLKNKVPKEGQYVLIKEKEKRLPSNNMLCNPEKYYVCVVGKSIVKEGELDFFSVVEEQCLWDKDEIIGWMPVDDLDEVFVEE